MSSWNFRHLRLAPSSQDDMCVCSHALHVEGGDLYNKKSFFPNDNSPRSALINEELSNLATLYYGKVDGIDSLDWGDLPSCRRRKLQERLDRLSLEDIFTTGPPQGDVGRYRSS